MIPISISNYVMWWAWWIDRQFVFYFCLCHSQKSRAQKNMPSSWKYGKQRKSLAKQKNWKKHNTRNIVIFDYIRITYVLISCIVSYATSYVSLSNTIFSKYYTKTCCCGGSGIKWVFGKVFFIRSCIYLCLKQYGFFFVDFIFD